MHGLGFFASLVKAITSRYAALLVFLVILIAVYPLVGTRPGAAWWLDLVYLLAIASAIRTISPHKRTFWVVLVLGIAAGTVGTAAGSFGLRVLYPYSAALRTLLYLVIVGFILRDLFGRTRVELDAIFGASCAYLLAGLGWGALYALIEWTAPGSFALPPEPQAVVERFGPETIDAQLVYFSLITMTTVGYGDITPVAPPARTLAALQGLLAQLYLAIIIGRMVGMELAERTTRKS